MVGSRTVIRRSGQAGLFAMSEIPDLVMPDGYKRSIAAWSARLATRRPSEPSGNLGPGQAHAARP